jgi:hypothetical protein
MGKRGLKKREIHVKGFAVSDIGSMRKMYTHVANNLNSRNNPQSTGNNGKPRSRNGYGVFCYGGDNRTRTCDPLRVEQVLYQLSYASIEYSRERMIPLSAVLMIW